MDKKHYLSFFIYLYRELRRQVEVKYGREDEFLRERGGKTRRIWKPWIRLWQLYEFSLCYGVSMEELETFIRENRILGRYDWGGHLVGWRCVLDQYLLIFYYVYGRKIRARVSHYEEYYRERGHERSVFILKGFMPEIGCRIGVARYLKDRMGYHGSEGKLMKSLRVL